MVYTSKLLIFAATVGNEVVEVIPMAEIVAIDASTAETAKTRRMSVLGSLDEDEMEDGKLDGSQATKSVQEVTIQTEPEGYNSGRSYRIRAVSARDCGLFMEDLDRMSEGARKKTQSQSVFRQFQAKV